MSVITPIRVFTVDDHPLLREGIAAIVSSQEDMLLVSQASSGTEAVDRFAELQPDVTLMDLRMPGMSGIEATVIIRSKFPGARIIMLTTFEGDMEIQRAMEAGARGYLLKNMPPNDLVAVIRQVHAGKKQMPPDVAAQIAEHVGEEDLSHREIQVLELVAAGHRNRDIGKELFISEETVKVHLRHIMEKLGTRDRTQSVSIALRRGIIQF